MSLMTIRLLADHFCKFIISPGHIRHVVRVYHYQFSKFKSARPSTSTIFNKLGINDYVITQYNIMAKYALLGITVFIIGY